MCANRRVVSSRRARMESAAAPPSGPERSSSGKALNPRRPQTTSVSGQAAATLSAPARNRPSLCTASIIRRGASNAIAAASTRPRRAAGVSEVRVSRRSSKTAVASWAQSFAAPLQRMRAPSARRNLRRPGAAQPAQLAEVRGARGSPSLLSRESPLGVDARRLCERAHTGQGGAREAM